MLLPAGETSTHLCSKLNNFKTLGDFVLSAHPVEASEGNLDDATRQKIEEKREAAKAKKAKLSATSSDPGSTTTGGSSKGSLAQVPLPE